VPQPNDGEVTCAMCNAALNRHDTNCYRCGGRDLNRHYAKLSVREEQVRRTLKAPAKMTEKEREARAARRLEIWARNYGMSPRLRKDLFENKTLPPQNLSTPRIDGGFSSVKPVYNVQVQGSPEEFEAFAKALYQSFRSVIRGIPLPSGVHGPLLQELRASFAHGKLSELLGVSVRIDPSWLNSHNPVHTVVLTGTTTKKSRGVRQGCGSVVYGRLSNV
jgi:hypothetical protein